MLNLCWGDGRCGPNGCCGCMQSSRRLYSVLPENAVTTSGLYLSYVQDRPWVCYWVSIHSPISCCLPIRYTLCSLIILNNKTVFSCHGAVWDPSRNKMVATAMNTSQYGAKMPAQNMSLITRAKCFFQRIITRLRWVYVWHTWILCFYTNAINNTHKCTNEWG